MLNGIVSSDLKSLICINKRPSVLTELLLWQYLSLKFGPPEPKDLLSISLVFNCPKSQWHLDLNRQS